MAALISVIAALYCAVFFLRETRRKIAVLFIVDSFVLAALFAASAAPAATAAFVVSAACMNITVFFMPPDAGGRAWGVADYAAITVNIITAVFAAFYILKSPQPARFNPGLLNPVTTAFLFMALSVAGYFTASAAAGEKK
jgi:hypothetical protein